MNGTPAFVLDRFPCFAALCLGLVGVLGMQPPPSSGPFEVQADRLEHPIPEPCFLAAAAHDTKRGYLLMFGGATPDNPDAPPTVRVLDLATAGWSTIDTSGPVPMAAVAPATAYVPQRDALYLFGGWARGAEQPSGELWTLALGGSGPAAWKLLKTTGSSPRRRNGAVMVFDPKRDRLVLHGGDGGPHPEYGYTPLDDLWAYEFKTEQWKRLSSTGDGPEPRWNHCGAIDPAGDKLYLFGGGGYTDSSFVADTTIFELDLQRLVWTRHEGSGELPTPVMGATLTLDPAAKALVMLGGLSLADEGRPGNARAWLFDLEKKAWSSYKFVLRTTRRGHVAIYDPKTRSHVIAGGQTARVRQNFFESGTPLRDAMRITIKRR